MAALPSLVCLKSVYNNKFLRYRYEDVQTHGLVQFSGEDVMDPYAQFEVEKSKLWDGLVHLKSRYTNKYLVRWSPNHYWITASAYAANEDQSSWTCTLFKPIVVDDSECDDIKKFRLLHVQLGHYACLWRIGAPFDSCLFAGSKDTDKDSCDILVVVDWEAIFKLPKRVAFKGNNGKYLGAQTCHCQPGLQFSFEDPKDPKVVQQIFPTPDGTIHVKSEHYGKFWSIRDDKWIMVDAEDPRGTDNAGAMFRLSVLGPNVVALLNMNPTWFVKRYTAAGRDNFLSAATQNIDECSRLEVVDVDTL